MVPDDGDKLWPTLGPQVCDYIETNLVFGPGDLRGQPAVLDDEKRALVYRMYEVFPQEHELAGRRRFQRVGFSLAKGLAKTEFAAWIAACELSPDAPVRTVGWDSYGNPIGGPVTDPYIPMVAYTEEQSDELAYGALKAILEESPISDLFDIGLERIMRVGGDGRAVSLSSSPSARDGARTTFSVMDEPLSLDTPIPTPNGWTTMGEIRVGDKVFGRDGKPCNVLGISEVHKNRDCYRVTFGDGTSIVADGQHRWRVYDHSPNYRRERTVNTRFMYEHEWANSKRFRLVSPKPMELPSTELPIDPYVFGLWLGDGDSRNATITVGKKDEAEIVASIKSVGYEATQCKTRSGRSPLYYVTFPDSRKSGWGAVQGQPDNYSVLGELRSLGVLGNKHIPGLYLRAGTEQRLALLQGLMDADGYISPSGVCTFSNSNLRIVRGMQELLRTLGYRPGDERKSIDHRWSSPSTIYKLNFRANIDAPPFRLVRKLARVNPRPQSINRALTVVSVDPVDSVPVRCIGVDSEDHLFLAGEGMIPTHNTHHWTLPRLKRAHQTMMGNLPKRKAADAWMLEVTTAPEPGAGSVAEDLMEYARMIADGRIKNARLFYFHRQASDEHDLTTEEGARAAVIEASGGAISWRNVDGAVELWRDPTTDRTWWERTWANRLVRSGSKAFDAVKWRRLKKESPIVPGALIVLGFDGAQFHDSTGLVATDVQTGFQWVLGLWERPPDLPDEAQWQVPVDEVDDAVEAAFETYDVWRMYADPPYWQETIAKWAGRYGEKRVIEWYTNRRRQMSHALESFDTAMKAGSISHDGDKHLERHIANAHKHELNMRDEETGRRLWLIRKERPDSPHKIDLAMAAVLSWEARMHAVAAGMDTPIDYNEFASDEYLDKLGW